MADPTLNDVLNGSADASDSPAPARRERQAVGGGGNAIDPRVGDSFEAVYNGYTDSNGKFGVSKLHKFTLLAPATLTVVHKDKDSGVKSEERKELADGTVITAFMKGNGDYLLNGIVVGDPNGIEVRRLEDDELPKGHKFAGTKVAKFEVFA